MYRDEQVIAIIVAAGSGKRFGSTLPKQFLKINGQTVLQKSVKAFNENTMVDYIIVVAGEGYTELAGELCSRFDKMRTVVTGGKERQDSVRNALKIIRGSGVTDNAILLIHDAARPFVTDTVVNAVIYGTAECGGAVPAVQVKDTVREATELGEFADMGEVLESGGYSIPMRTPDRGLLCSVQTPQGFRAGILTAAYEKAYDEGFFGTDDASIVDRMGINLKIVKGDYSNYKITTKEDIPAEMRIGTGYDVHRLTEGRELYLCGVKIPHEKGLLGHSDADVALHALMDALLGAAGMGDIGRHFPDSDEKYKGISSMKLLEDVCRILEYEGYSVGNVDLTVMAQRPKIALHISQMKKNVADILGIDESAVNIKGTTTEGLGFVGREEGIAAEAVCILQRNSK